MPESRQGEETRGRGEATRGPSYPFRELSERAQERWRKERLFELDDPMAADRRFYCLNTFPHPSGDLHARHGPHYILGDALPGAKKLPTYTRLAPTRSD